MRSRLRIEIDQTFLVTPSNQKLINKLDQKEAIAF